MSVSLRAKVTVFAVKVLAVICTTPMNAQTPELDLKSARLWGAAGTVVMEVDLEIETRRGSKTRSVEVYLDNSGDESKLFARVVSPPFLRHMKYLYTRSSNGTESKWVGTSRGARQLTNADRSEKLFDSDFTTEDLSELVVEDYAVTYEPETDNETVVVRAVPRTSGSATRLIWIDQDTNLIVRLEYRTADDTIQRVYVMEETQMVDGIVAVRTCRMTDPAAGSSTLLTVDEFQPNARIPSRMFSRASL